jgi:hypothetical protein
MVPGMRRSGVLGVMGLTGHWRIPDSGALDRPGKPLDELSRGVIWHGFGENKKLVLESVLQYGRDTGYNIFITGNISGIWRNRTLYIDDTKSGPVTEL